MANFCAITTKENLELMDENDVHFILTRQLEQPEFQEYLTNTDKPWILDCDSFEIMQEKGKYEPTDFNHTLELAKKFHPTYMILPDYICNAEETIKAAEQYLEKVKEIGVKPIGAIQARVYNEITWVTTKFWEMGIRCFAVPFGAPEFSDRAARNSRMKRFEVFINIIKLLENRTKENMEYLHFLGMNQNINELFLVPKEVNSLDSGKPVQFARAYKKLSDTAEVSNSIHVEGELDLKLTEEQTQLAKENIAFARWALRIPAINAEQYRGFTVADLAPWKDEHRIEAALLGLVEEIGELSSPINKALRKYGDPKKASYEKVRGELSDVAFYFNMLLKEFNISYEEIINYNYKKLRERYSVSGYTAEAADLQKDKKIVKE